ANTVDDRPNTTGSDEKYPSVTSVPVTHCGHTSESGTHAIGRGPNDTVSHSPVRPREASAASTSWTSTPTQFPSTSGSCASHSRARSSTVENNCGATATGTRYTPPPHPARNNITNPAVNAEATNTDTNVIRIHGATGSFEPPFLRRRPVR